MILCGISLFFSLYLRGQFSNGMFMNMKKLFLYLSAALSAVAFVSCDNPKKEYTQEFFLDNIYTVNKHTVTPEFGDTSYMVSNMNSYPLQTGDRVRMMLRFYYDAFSGKMPEWEIYAVDEVIPTRPLQARNSVDTTEYATPFIAITYYELMDRLCNPVWIWKNRQNINIIYKGMRNGAEFAMSVRGVTDGYIDLDLFAKATAEGNTQTEQLLTFDLENVCDFLTAEEKNSIAGHDSLQTRIFFKRLDNNTLKEVKIIGGTFANPLK